jgi:hypothetical protein
MIQNLNISNINENFTSKINKQIDEQQKTEEEEEEQSQQKTEEEEEEQSQQKTEEEEEEQSQEEEEQKKKIIRNIQMKTKNKKKSTKKNNESIIRSLKENFIDKILKDNNKKDNFKKDNFILKPNPVDKEIDKKLENLDKVLELFKQKMK